MTFSLGGVEWNFDVKYTGEAAAKRIKRDLESVQTVTKQTNQSRKEFAKASEEVRKAVEREAQAVRNLAKAKQAEAKVNQLINWNLRSGRGFTRAMRSAQARAEFERIRASERAAVAKKNLANATNTANVAAVKHVKTLQKQTQSMSQMVNHANHAAQAVTALTLVMGTNVISSAIADWTLLAGRVENLGTVLNNVGSIAGFSRGAIARLEESVTALGITTRNARRSMALLAQGNIDLEKSTRLARIAQDAAVIAGINSSDAFQRMVIAIQRTNTWMLRNLGILVNLNTIYRDYAVTNGRVVTTLSTSEKQQILMNKVMEIGTRIAGTYESALGDVYKQWTSLDRITEEAKKQFGEQFLPVFQLVVDTITYLAKGFKALTPEQKAVIAGLSAAIVVATAAAAAFSTLTVALAAANAAYGNVGPAFLAIAAASAVAAGVAAGAATAYAAALRGQKQALQDAETAGAALANRTFQLTKVREELLAIEAQVSDQNEITIDQHNRINALYAEAIGLLPKYKEELQTFDSGELVEFRRRIEQINNSITLDAESQIEEAKNELRQAQRDLKLFEDGVVAAARKTRAGGTGLRLYNYSEADAARAQYLERTRSYQAQLAIVAELTGKVRELEIAEASYQERIFSDRLKKLEAANAQALRVTQLGATDRKNVWEDANLDILLNHAKTMKNLSNQTISEAELEVAIESKKARKLSEINAGYLARRQEIAESDEEIIVKQKQIETALRTREAQLTNLNDLLRAEAENVREMNEQVIAALKEANDLIDAKIEKKKLELDLLEEEQALVQEGEDERLAALKINLKREQLEKKKQEEAFFQQRKEIFDKGMEYAAKARQADSEGRAEDHRTYVKLYNQQVELLGKTEELERQTIREGDLAIHDARMELKKREKELAEEARKEEEKAEKERLDAIEDEKREREKAARERERNNKELFRKLEKERKAREKAIEEEVERLEQLIDLREELADLERERTEMLAEERVRGVKRVMEAERDLLDEQEEALEKLRDDFDEFRKSQEKMIEMRREFGKLLAMGFSPGQAKAAIVEKFDIAPLTDQIFKRAIDFKLKEIEGRREDIAELETKLRLEEERRHEEDVRRKMGEAARKREEIRKEIEEIKMAMKDHYAFADPEVRKEGEARKKELELREKELKAAEEAGRKDADDLFASRPGASDVIKSDPALAAMRKELAVKKKIIDDELERLGLPKIMGEGALPPRPVTPPANYEEMLGRRRASAAEGSASRLERHLAGMSDETTARRSRLEQQRKDRIAARLRERKGRLGLVPSSAFKAYLEEREGLERAKALHPSAAAAFKDMEAKAKARPPFIPASGLPAPDAGFGIPDFGGSAPGMPDAAAGAALEQQKQGQLAQQQAKALNQSMEAQKQALLVAQDATMKTIEKAQQVSQEVANASSRFQSAFSSRGLS